MSSRHGSSPSREGNSQAARLERAFALLQRGRAAEAETIAREVARHHPGSGPAFHMLALCRKATGNLQGARQAFETALGLSPRDPHLLGNFANHLSGTDQLDRAIELYRRALELAPEHAQGWLNYGLALEAHGDPAAAAAALERAVALAPRSSSAWQALGAARRASGEPEAARTAFLEAVRVDPGNGGAWTSLGVVHRLLGDPAAALECYARARAAGFQGPELEDASASACLDLGEPERAIEIARRLVDGRPDYVPGHALLANLCWEHGTKTGEEPMAAFRTAVERQPENIPLRREFVNFLLQAGAPGEALAQVQDLRQRDDQPGWTALEASAHEMLGDGAAAARLFAASYPALRGDPGFLNLYVRHLLRTRQPERAATLAREALDIDARNQLALASLGVAWRMLDDPREDWLCGYDRLVAAWELPVPPGYSGLPEFLGALEQTLDRLHTAQREPVNQSLRGGSQTSGLLFGRRDPVIEALRDAIAATVARHVAALPEDPSHPFLQRKSSQVRFAGSWSVRLRSAGRHVNHIHQQGWISSACYVVLPPSVRQADPSGNEGCIQFGEPPAELGLDLGPRRVVRPEPGMLVLFPSYLWHGTVPFHDDGAVRMTVAFDAVPVNPETPPGRPGRSQ